MASGVIVLGPIGLVILHIQWILITNFVANEVCSRLIIPNLNWQVWKLTLAFYDIEETPQLMMKEYENPNLKEESNDWWWIVKGVYHVLHFNKKFILIALSIVPILGPLTVNMIEARDRSIKCLRPFFKQMGWSKSQVKEFKLEKKPQLILFGLTSGILDSIPFVSILTNTSNLVGGSLWAVDIMNQEGGIELDKLKGE